MRASRCVLAGLWAFVLLAGYAPEARAASVLTGSITAPPITVAVGTTYQWSLTLANTGDMPTGAVTIDATFDSSVQTVVSADSRCVVQGDQIDCALGVLAAGSSTVLAFSSRADIDLGFSQALFVRDSIKGLAFELGFASETYDPSDLPDPRVTSVEAHPVDGQPGLYDITWIIDNAGGRATLNIHFDVGTDGSSVVSVERLDPGPALECNFNNLRFVPCNTDWVPAHKRLVFRQRVSTPPNSNVSRAAAFSGLLGHVPDRDRTNNFLTIDLNPAPSSAPAAPAATPPATVDPSTPSDTKPLPPQSTKRQTPPRLLRSPRILGQPHIGGLLTATSGSWTGSPSLTFRWQTCANGRCINIRHATRRTYRVATAQAGERIRLLVIAQYPSLTLRRPSHTTAVVPPVTRSRPEIR